MKLKSLTLNGFKSFARKTTFDFPDGVTCVVGPNGCGKSNLVDAIKWVLGEQSAKSLRGGEMADVIFNGTAQRRSAGYAEVSLAFEDAADVLSRLGEGAAEGGDGDHTVTIARRLYRNGESEYLINRQVARLKDVREMFLDTGVGANAYSLIEQGKVETFLQASAADRRALFDEAAGISTYKTRKAEALRRLDRVEQNLLRLTDILGEVQKRLRSIKYQAGKARSYRQHSARLKELRSLFSLAEYHRLGLRRRELQGQVDGLTDGLAGVAARIDRLETSRTATDTEIADLQQKARQLDGRLAEVSAQSAGCEQRAEMLDGRARELADAIAADAARAEQAEARIEADDREVAAGRERLAALARRIGGLECRLQDADQRHDAARRELEALRERLEDEKNGTIELLRRTAELHNEINTHALRRENLHVRRQRLSGRSEEIAAALEELFTRRAAVQARLDDVRGVLTESESKLDHAHREAERLQAADAQAAEALSEVRQRHSAMTSRQAVLEEMLARLEGIGEGVRRVLGASREGRLRTGPEGRAVVRGMLGELIETDVAHAGVIQAALAGAEQRLIADRLSDVLGVAGELRDMLADAGGVELMCLDRLDGPPAAAAPAVAGVVARAADWVRCEPPLRAAVEAVLGRTLVVESLQRAFELSGELGGSWRFVTAAGEVLEPDGRVRVGAGQAGAGLIRRKSELAELARRLDDSRRRIHELSLRKEEIAARRTHLESVVQAMRTAIYEASAERVEQEGMLERLDEQIAAHRREAPLLEEELRQLAGEIEAAVRGEREAAEQAAGLESRRAEGEASVARLNEAIASASRRQEVASAERTEAQVALAEARQQRDGLSESLDRLVESARARREELAGLRQQMERSRERRAEAQEQARQARGRMQDLLAERDALTREVEESAETRRSLEQRVGEIRNQLATERKAHDDASGRLNELRVQLGEVEVRIENLIARAGEEIALDLPEAYPRYTHDEDRDWDAVREEIADLRGKIERLGNVNLDAIAEQDTLQQREEFLNGQLEDVRASQRKLSDLIKRINAESRRRFEETFEAVRTHFNELFRKLFGGGKADVLLTEPENVLDSGIEVVARPPGKELRSITLLSGGEKTLTALALMFSFFRARPTPFCLLDEVDAALDEANTERFTQLLREFLETSQFVTISHAKRTISMADQIYGVTMQEPGVSTRISVRFEDVHKYTDSAAAEPVGA